MCVFSTPATVLRRPVKTVIRNRLDFFLYLPKPVTNCHSCVCFWKVIKIQYILATNWRFCYYDMIFSFTLLQTMYSQNQNRKQREKNIQIFCFLIDPLKIEWTCNKCVGGVFVCNVFLGGWTNVTVKCVRMRWCAVIFFVAL